MYKLISGNILRVLLLVVVFSVHYSHCQLKKDVLLTISEREKLELLRERVQDKLPEYYMQSDFYLLRWLKARNFNVDNAEKMLLENLRWRQENRMNTILKEDFTDINDDYPLTTEGEDKKGLPLGTISYGSWDIRGAALQGKMQRILRYMDYFQEKLVHRIIKSRDTDSPVSKAVVIVDLEGFNFLHHTCPSCLQVFFRIVIGMENHYPGFWEEIIVVNAPGIFRMFNDAIKGMLDPENQNTLKFFDSNRKKWMNYLDRRIDRDQRFVKFGGTRLPTKVRIQKNMENVTNSSQ